MRLPRPLLAALVLLLYFGSESLLRNRVHPAGVGDDSQAEAVLDSLPTFIRGYVQHRREVRDLRERLARAKTPPERLQVLTTLAAILSGGERRDALDRIVADCGHLPGAAMAVAEVATADHPPAGAVAAYLAYVDRCELTGGADQRLVWQTGWQMVRKFPDDARYAYLCPFAATGLLDPGFADAWSDLRGLAVRRGDEAVLARAKTLERHTRNVAPPDGRPNNAW